MADTLIFAPLGFFFSCFGFFALVSVSALVLGGFFYWVVAHFHSVLSVHDTPPCCIPVVSCFVRLGNVLMTLG